MSGGTTVRPAQPTTVAAPAAPQTVETKERPISTGGWFGILFLLALPVLNLLLLIIWAVGGTGRVNKKNFARAVLLWMAIGVVLSILVAVIFSVFFSESGMIEKIKELIRNS
jgi:amino acid transporter